MSWLKPFATTYANNFEILISWKTKKDESDASDNISGNELKSLMADHVLIDLRKERQTERRWRWIKRIAFSTIGVGLFGMYLAFYASSLGYKLILNVDIVAIVNVSGNIGLEQLASAEELVPVLEKVFESPKVKAIALNIDTHSSVIPVLLLLICWLSIQTELWPGAIAWWDQ
jgi:hypothetical protein